MIAMSGAMGLCSALCRYCWFTSCGCGCYCWVAHSCPTLHDPMDCSTPGFPVLHHLPELAQIHVHWVSDAVQPSHLLFALHMRWPKYWSFSFSISPSNEHPGLISFRMDWLDLLAVQGILKSLTTVKKHQFFSAQPSLWSNSRIHTWLLEKP